MIDSRERNSADGSLVQKARRQVEIFQSQGNGGRSVQVVRASQWSSSRSTDCALDSPLARPNNAHYIDDIASAFPIGHHSLQPAGPLLAISPPPRLSLWDSALEPARLSMSDPFDSHRQGRSDLDCLSRLCRELHEEAMSTTSHLWSLRAATPAAPPLFRMHQPSPPPPPALFSVASTISSSSSSPPPAFNCLPLEDASTSHRRPNFESPSPISAASTYSSQTSHHLLTSERRSSSSDDLAAAVAAVGECPMAEEEARRFARDCRARRSLQHNGVLGGTSSSSSQTTTRTSYEESSGSSSVEQRQEQRSNESPAVGRTRQELIAERARLFEGDLNAGSGVDCLETEAETSHQRRRLVVGSSRERVDGGSFASIADNDFVKNDPRHRSKLLQLGVKVAASDVATSHQSAIPPVPAPRTSIRAESSSSTTSATTSSTSTTRTRTRSASPIAPSRLAARLNSNRTVVHLRNSASPAGKDNYGDDDHDNDFDYEVEVGGATTESDGGCVNGHYGMLMDASSTTREESTGTSTTTTAVNGGRPAKRVEFCKTEIHFAPDSGKVNIVETDGKPPPTNKFRRRRRNGNGNGLGTNGSGSAQKSNMPLVHFGDTSYEKYIFGGPKQQTAEEHRRTAIRCESPATSTRRNSAGDVDSADRLFGRADKWGSESREDSLPVSLASLKDCPADKVAEHPGRSRGTHTTTVNILRDEGTRGGLGSAVARVSEDKTINGTAFPGLIVNRSPSRDRLGASSPDRHRRPLADQQYHHHRRSSPPPPKDTDADDDRQVLVKIITGHKPSLARMGSPEERRRARGHSPSPARSGLGYLAELGGKRATGSTTSTAAAASTSFDLEALAPYCDMRTEAPTYENVFDARSGGIHDDEAPLYENFHRGVPVIGVKLHRKPSSTLATAASRTSAAGEKKRTSLVDSLRSRKRAATATTSGASSTRPTARSTTRTGLERRTANGGTTSAGPGVVRTRSNSGERHPSLIGHRTGLLAAGAAEDTPAARRRALGEKARSSAAAAAAAARRSSSRSPAPSAAAAAAAARRASLSPRPSRREVVNGGGSSTIRRPSRDGIAAAGGGSSSRASSVSAGGSRDASRSASIRQPRKDAATTPTSTRGISKVNGTTKASNSSADAQQSKSLQRSVGGTLKNGGTLKSKKPVEVVYQTAIYNMKNEKLSKPSKAKEAKGPRLLNDLICGSKLRRPADNNKKIRKTATVSQNTSKRKETPVK